MIGNRRILAVIPARGGSKGIPRKNIRLLGGKPLIAWSIEQALQSKYVDRVIVSSDDEEICQIAQTFGADVPFIRPDYLATDNATGVDVLCHALEATENIFEYVVFLQPTSPLRKPEDIDGAIERCYERGVNSVVSMAEAPKSPFWMYQLDENDQLIPFLESPTSNRQELPVSYLINGAVYVLDVTYLLGHRQIISKQTLSYLMPVERSIDIDNEIDFLICDYITQNNQRDG